MTMFPNRSRGSKVFAVLSVMLLGSSSLAKPAPQTVEYKFPGGVDQVTFDPSRVRMDDLNRWMELSPLLGNDNFMIVPEGLELCKSEDSRYHCEAEGKWNVGNAQLNLRAIEDRIKKLGPKNYPPELAEVVAYLRRLQSVYLWMHQQELSFLQTNDVTILEMKYGEVDPRKSCDSDIQRIRSANDPTLRSHLVRFDWYNCVLALAQRQLGPYPLEQWKSFLHAYGIQEQRVDEEVDD